MFLTCCRCQPAVLPPFLCLHCLFKSPLNPPRMRRRPRTEQIAAETWPRPSSSSSSTALFLTDQLIPINGSARLVGRASGHAERQRYGGRRRRAVFFPHHQHGNRDIFLPFFFFVSVGTTRSCVIDAGVSPPASVGHPGYITRITDRDATAYAAQ